MNTYMHTYLITQLTNLPTEIRSPTHRISLIVYARKILTHRAQNLFFNHRMCLLAQIQGKHWTFTAKWRAGRVSTSNTECVLARRICSLKPILTYMKALLALHCSVRNWHIDNIEYILPRKTYSWKYARVEYVPLKIHAYFWESSAGAMPPRATSKWHVTT